VLPEYVDLKNELPELLLYNAWNPSEAIPVLLSVRFSEAVPVLTVSATVMLAFVVANFGDCGIDAANVGFGYVPARTPPATPVGGLAAFTQADPSQKYDSFVSVSKII
jgi:hypothetical protein